MSIFNIKNKNILLKCINKKIIVMFKRKSYNENTKL